MNLNNSNIIQKIPKKRRPILKSDFYVEAFGKKIEQKILIEKVKDIWKSQDKRVKDISTLEMYYKPEEAKCYYVINGKIDGSFDV